MSSILKVDQLQDSGGNAIITSDGSGNLTPNFNNAGNLIKISTATLSSDSLIEFDLDSTYDHYIFRFSKVHNSDDNKDLRFDVSLTSDTDYASATVTLLLIRDSQSESSGNLVANNAASSTGTTGTGNIFKGASADNDHCIDGTFELHNPASTTFTKSFHSIMHGVQYADNVRRETLVGEVRSATAVDKIKFFMESGNLDSGTITQYGVKT